MITVRSVLAATDLTEAGNSVVRTALSVAAAFNAEVHVVHVVAPWKNHDEVPSVSALEAQIARCFDDLGMNSGTLAVDAAVVHDRPYHGILVHASTVGADLIVMGRHRGSTALARWWATTAERVVRSSDVPCLVVGTDLSSPLRRVGVALDFGPASRAGGHLMVHWLPKLGPADGRSVLTLLHAASDAGAGVNARLEEEVARIRDGANDGLRVEGLVLDGMDPARSLAQWTDETDADLIVALSEGRRGFRRVWWGSDAAVLAVHASCPVLLIPPVLWRRASISLSRVVVAADMQSGPVVDWLGEWGKNASTPAFHVIDESEDILRDAKAEGADLLVVQEPVREAYAALRPELAGLLERTPVPVLVLRDLPEHGIRRVLVAVDTGDIWYEKLGWAKLVADRFGADITIFHAINLSVRSRVRREPGGELVSASSVWLHDGLERKVMPAMQAWLWERARLANLPLDRVDIKIGLQDPWFAVPTVAQQEKADLVIIAAHAEHGPNRASLSRVARATLERGTYSALVVVDRARRQAAWGGAPTSSDRRVVPRS